MDVLTVTFIITAILLILVSLMHYICIQKGVNTCSKHMVGKVVIVTGGNRGIGYETVKDLAFRGAKVIIASIDPALGIKARDEIAKITGNQNVYFKYLDLASFKSIRKFADEILHTESQLDILINNAGVLDYGTITEDGLLQGMQINYFGPFLLTNLLLPLLISSAPSRIINVSSRIYSQGKVDLENLNLEKETFSIKKYYCNSKLCVNLMTVEMSRRLRGTGVTANCLHPGVVVSSIMEKILDQSNILKYTTNVLYTYVLRYFVKNCWEGAQTTLFLAVSDDVKDLSGRYFVDCREEPMVAVALDLKVARKLWNVSEKIVKLK